MFKMDKNTLFNLQYLRCRKSRNAMTIFHKSRVRGEGGEI